MVGWKPPDNSAVNRPLASSAVSGAMTTAVEGAPGLMPTLDVEQQALRVFDGVLDPHQEGHRFLAVDHPVVVAHRQVHHRPDHHLAADRHRPVLYLVHP